MSAYAEHYLERAQRSLATMFDHVVWDLALDIDRYADWFVVSGYADRFGAGDPAVVSAISGVELARAVIAKVGAGVPIRSPRPTENRSREFWTGWALAYYQWKAARRFRDIFGSVRASHIRALYSPYHEMSLAQFCDRMEELYAAANPNPRLKVMRQAAGLSQSELAERTGVNLRTLQHYEQGEKDLRRAAGETILALARALGTTVESLLA